MTISATYVNMMLDQLLGATYNSTEYTHLANISIGLSSTAPTNTGTNITEPSGGGYARVVVANNGTNWSASSGASKVNAAAITFPTATASWGSVSYWFAMDSTGAFIFSGALAGAPITVPSGSTPSFAAGSLTINES